MPAPVPVVLLIEDEPQMRRFLSATLRAHDYHIVEAATAREGLAQAAGRNPDLVLLDLGLPDGDGLEVARSIRRSARTPIIVISARGQEHDKVTALDLGADDYLTKPFGVPELLARMRVALRHAAVSVDSPPEPVFQAGGIRVDLLRREVLRDHEEVHLTPTEYELLKAFISHPNKVLTDRMLLQWVWGGQYGAQDHYLHVYVARLRKKLDPEAQSPRYLVTEPGVGYRLLADEG
jgi:two-component system KDP operon response regulator KdpE